jgi:fructose-bisphosphate aldolase class II
MGVHDIVPAGKFSCSIVIDDIEQRFLVGVLTGDNVLKLFAYAKKHQFAIPAINVTSSSAINAVLEAAANAKSPVIIQISQGGAQFFAGKSLNNDGQAASILGAVAGAHHVRTVAKTYGVPVVLHSDHCAKKLEPWLVDFQTLHFNHLHENIKH